MRTGFIICLSVLCIGMSPMQSQAQQRREVDPFEQMEQMFREMRMQMEQNFRMMDSLQAQKGNGSFFHISPDSSASSFFFRMDTLIQGDNMSHFFSPFGDMRGFDELFERMEKWGHSDQSKVPMPADDGQSPADDGLLPEERLRKQEQQKEQPAAPQKKPKLKTIRI
jgi:hypothetical protein